MTWVRCELCPQRAFALKRETDILRANTNATWKLISGVAELWTDCCEEKRKELVEFCQVIKWKFHRWVAFYQGLEGWDTPAPAIKETAHANTRVPSEDTKNVGDGHETQEWPALPASSREVLSGPGSGSADQILVNLRQSQGISNQVARKEGVWRDWEGSGS